MGKRVRLLLHACSATCPAPQTLSNGDARAAYNARLETALADDEDDYSGEALSKWMPALSPKMAKNEDPAEDRAVFVVRLVCCDCSSRWCMWLCSSSSSLQCLRVC
jgi:hypothetical protein